MSWKKLVCVFLGHDYVNKMSSLITMIEDKGMKFDPKKYEEAFNDTWRLMDENPVVKKRCKRCGHTIDTPSHFIEIYKAKINGVG